MSSVENTGKLIWFLNRWRCMSLAETFHRFERLVMLRIVKAGLLPTGAASVAMPVGMGTKVSVDTSRIAPERYLEEADLILNGNVTLFANQRFDVGAVPQWNRDPLTEVTAPNVFGFDLMLTDRSLVGDIKYVWEFNRHLHLVRVAQAYALSGDHRYIDGLHNQLNSWLEQCPPLLGPNWASSLETAIRLVNWSMIWNILDGWDGPLFRGSDGNRLRAVFLDSVYAQCQFILRNIPRHSSANNHLIGELTGLYVAARTWPCWKDLLGWGKSAKVELEREILLQHSTDGVNREQAFWYHIFVSEFLLIAGIAGQVSSDPFSENYWKAIQRSMTFLRSMRNVQGHIPMVGDADDGVVLRLEPGNGSHRADFLLGVERALSEDSGTEPRSDAIHWMVGDLPPVPPLTNAFKETDWRFPDGGYFIFGSDIGEKNEVKGLIDCGPLGYLGIAAHGHADALSLVLSVCGEQCLVDPGTYSYRKELKWRDYFRGTSAHNTVRIDGLDQSVKGGRFMWTHKAKARVETMPGSFSQFDFTGSHDGYMRLKDPVRHVRSVTFDARYRILTVRDQVKGNAAHLIEQFWHFAPHLLVQIVDSIVQIKGKGFEIRVEFAGNDVNIESIVGDEETPLGWYSDAYESKSPCTVIRVWTRTTALNLETKFLIKTGLAELGMR